MWKTAKAKPVEIQYIKLTKNNIDDVFDLIGEHAYIETNLLNFKRSLIIETKEGEMKAKPGDYIIKGIIGEFYPCKSSVFKAKYETINNL
jgi:hypothetical protein